MLSVKPTMADEQSISRVLNGVTLAYSAGRHCDAQDRVRQQNGSITRV
jgi:hypothetical protein